MKTVSDTLLQDHLLQEVTGLATCWEIERVDGKVYRFTDADEDLTVEGFTYSSIGAYKRTAIETSATLSVDNLEVIGLASELSLSSQDLRNGLYDNARVSVFMCTWSDAVPGKIKLRRGFFGEVQTLPNETFQVELRGLMQRLSYNYTDIFNATCLYDLGEPSCGITIRPPDREAFKFYTVGDTVLAPVYASYDTSKRYPAEVGDGGFETLAVGGFATSVYWYDSGAVPMTTTDVGAFAGNSLVGGAGAGAIAQVFDIASSSDLDFDKVLEGDATFSLHGYRKNEGGDTGRVKVSFLDDDGNTVSVGKAVRSNDGLTYTNQTTIAGDCTVMFWIKPDNLDRGGIMAGGNRADTSQTGTFSSLVYENNAIELWTNSNNRVGYNMMIQTPQFGSLTRIEVGEWNHVCLVKEGTTLTAYINFEFSATAPYSDPIYFQTLFDAFTENAFDNGFLDDVRIYNVAKTYDDLILETKSDPVLPDANLLNWFSFDGDTIDDDTGNAGVLTTVLPTISFEMSQAPFNGTGVPIGYDSGDTDAGVAWTRFETTHMYIPPHSKSVKIELLASGSGAYFDEIGATLYDTTEQSSVILPSQFNNLYWEATTSGTTNESLPEFTGNVGDLVIDNGAIVWEAKDAYLRAGRVYTTTNRRIFTAVIDEPRAVDGWFQGGTVIFVTGKNAGVSMEIKKWTQASGELQLFLSVPYDISPDDEFFLYPGCDKTRISCAAIFRNIPNFFGFPDVPGTDELMRYPDAVA